MKKKNLTIVAPSQWMLRSAQNSGVLPQSTRFELIRYGLDLDVWQPVKQTIARRQLGIETGRERMLIGFGAENIHYPRKGFHLLVESLQQLPAENPIELLVFGSGDLPSEVTDRFPTHALGYVDSPARQALIYSAMDCFVLPSLEDNSPQTGLEAMACGTPVIGFQAGGIPEYVFHRRTGLLAPTGDANELARAMQWLADHPAAVTAMGDQARALIEQQFNVQRQSKQYIDLYSELLGIQQRQGLIGRHAVKNSGSPTATRSSHRTASAS